MSLNLSISRLGLGGRAGGGAAAEDLTGLSLPVDYWIDDALGNDSNAGTSEGAAWASLNKIDTLTLTSGTTTTVRIKSGTYDKVTDLVQVNQTTTGATLNLVFEAGCVNDGTAYTTANTTGSFIDPQGAGYTLNLYGNGLTVQDWTQGTGNGLGGNGVDATCIFNAYNVSITNCIDGISLHGGMVGNFYDCVVTACLKASVAHIGTTSGTHTRCRFEEVSGGGTAAFIINTSTSEWDFTDCIFIPQASGSNFPVDNCNFLRCQIGTATLAVAATGAYASTTCTITDSFVNLSMDASRFETTMTRCYGLFSVRQRNGSPGFTMENCVIGGPRTGLSNIFYRNAELNPATPHYIRNNIFETATAAAFMNYTATTTDSLVAQGSEWHNNILSGSAAFDADLIASDTGNTVIVDNVTADALIGAANTLDPDDYGYTTGSPAIGAGIGGTNCGFGVGEVAAPIGPLS